VRLSALHKGVHTTDPFWDNAPAAYWSVVELNCGILCACLPTLRPLIQKAVPHLLSTHGHHDRTEDASNKISTLDSQRTRGDLEDGIYVRKDIEMHSTTELSKNAGYRPSFEGGASQKTEITAQSSLG